MQYAPVIIPTLNRYEHFKRCLESLEKCTGADKTDVYVGLDYPPSEKYVEGWKKIDEYLKGKEVNNGFAKLVVDRRDHNYGVCNENDNDTALLRERIFPYYDRYIYTEDDNEFSPCFLDFMNKALEKYKDDAKVYSVCGFTQPGYEVKGQDVIFIYDNSAWGLGKWVNREKPDLEYVKSKLKSFSSVLKVWKRYPALLNSLLTMVQRNVLYGDATHTLKCICEERYQVRPSCSLVRNTGNDGSGMHCNINDSFSSQKISDERQFIISEEIVERTKQLDSRVRNNLRPKSFLRKLKYDLLLVKRYLSYRFKVN